MDHHGDPRAHHPGSARLGKCIRRAGSAHRWHHRCRIPQRHLRRPPRSQNQTARQRVVPQSARHRRRAAATAAHAAARAADPRAATTAAHAAVPATAHATAPATAHATAHAASPRSPATAPPVGSSASGRQSFCALAIRCAATAFRAYPAKGKRQFQFRPPAHATARPGRASDATSGGRPAAHATTRSSLRPSGSITRSIRRKTRQLIRPLCLQQCLVGRTGGSSPGTRRRTSSRLRRLRQRPALRRATQAAAAAARIRSIQRAAAITTFPGLAIARAATTSTAVRAAPVIFRRRARDKQRARIPKTRHGLPHWHRTAARARRIVWRQRLRQNTLERHATSLHRGRPGTAAAALRATASAARADTRARLSELSHSRIPGRAATHTPAASGRPFHRPSSAASRSSLLLSTCSAHRHAPKTRRRFQPRHLPCQHRRRRAAHASRTSRRE